MLPLLFTNATLLLFTNATSLTPSDSMDPPGEPPDLVLQQHDPLLRALWFLSADVRETLASEAWTEKLGEGRRPHFCVHNGFCRYFDTREQLERHWEKKAGHRADEQVADDRRESERAPCK